MEQKDSVFPFFITWVISVAVFIILVETGGSSSGQYSDFEMLALFGSMGIGSVSFIIALFYATKQNKNSYAWSLIVGFILFFYVLVQMAN